MKIAIIGTKGIPANYGGFETFAFKLAKHLSNSSHEITVVNEKDNHAITFDFPVQIVYSKYKKSKNPLLFYKHSLNLVSKSHDVVLVCGVGGAAFYLWNRGNAIIVTNVDGLEHLRRKYTFLQRKFVFGLQKLAASFSDYLVADSLEVEKYWSKRFNAIENKLTAIAYGADLPMEFDDSILGTYKLEKNHYYLVVARLVPENNLLMIIESFANYKGNKKLVVVGDISDNPFAKSISSIVNDKIVFVGSVYKKNKLDSLRINSFAYIHGHSVGGTNPALLEAMICKCACICHDNVFNREVTSNKQIYFNSAEYLLNLIIELESSNELTTTLSISAFERVTENYSWSKIAGQYEELFSNLILSKRR